MIGHLCTLRDIGTVPGVILRFSSSEGCYEIWHPHYNLPFVETPLAILDPASPDQIAAAEAQRDAYHARKVSP